VLANFLSQRLSTVTLGAIAVQWDVRIDPSSWAFVIWALIYSTIAVYIVYQILPNSWIPPPKGQYSRNEDLLVNKIYWILPVHLIGNGGWLFLF
jgi:hypothetical protein